MKGRYVCKRIVSPSAYFGCSMFLETALNSYMFSVPICLYLSTCLFVRHACSVLLPLPALLPVYLFVRLSARLPVYPSVTDRVAVHSGGVEAKSTPQLVLLTFDDSINDINRELYKEMFETGRKNPNGCPISATFYVSHEWTDYKQVQNLWADGHEIASHSIR